MGLPFSLGWLTISTWPTRTLSLRKFTRSSFVSCLAHIHRLGEEIWFVALCYYVLFDHGVHFWLGDITHFTVFGKHTFVLNSYEDCVELLERRSGIYSDRPAMPMMELYVASCRLYLDKLIIHTNSNLGWDGPTSMLR